MSKFSFPCGCNFDITNIKLADGRPSIKFRAEVTKINMNCSKVWDMISAGNTKGVFQLESPLGQSLARKMKPRNIEHLAALISIMRPGVLEAVRDKKSVTMHYIDRKNGAEEVSYFHPALEKCLKTTYGEMVYQEQAMQIARDIAGFTMQEADELRKAIGKKLPEAMAKVKTKFLEGTKKSGVVTEDESHQIFDWIEKSQRYSFNKSHAVSYAYNGYLSAFAKAHFSRAFFTSYLRYSGEKQKPYIEIYQLGQNARIMSIEVCGPDLRNGYKHFKLHDKKIYFGLMDLKGIGDAVWNKMLTALDAVKKQLRKEVADWTWLEFLVFYTPKINSTAVTALINSGALSYMGMDRTEMMYEYNIYTQLSPKETKWVEVFVVGGTEMRLHELLRMIVHLPANRANACNTERRKTIVQGLYNTLIHPTYKLKDSPEWLASIETSLMGIPITCTSVEACDISAANCTCIEYIEGKHPKTVIIAAQVDSCHEITVKQGKNKGQKMAFLKISDITGTAENIVVFSDVWDEVSNVVFEGNNLLLYGEKSKDGASLVVRRVWQI